MAGGSEQKLPSHPLPHAVATARVAPPPAHAVSVHPDRCRARIRSRTSPSSCCPGFPPLARSESLANRNPSYAAALLDLRRRLAGVAGHHSPIAWTSSCASSSSTSSPSGASRDAAVSPSSSSYCTDTARSSSSIPAPSSLPVPHRHLHRLRGERANRSISFSLSLVHRGVSTVSGSSAAVPCR